MVVLYVSLVNNGSRLDGDSSTLSGLKSGRETRESRLHEARHCRSKVPVEEDNLSFEE